MTHLEIIGDTTYHTVGNGGLVMGYGSKEGGKKIYREYGWSGSLVGGEYVKSAWRMWRVVTARHHASSPQPAPVQEGGSPLLNLFPKITIFYNNVSHDYTKLIHTHLYRPPIHLHQHSYSCAHSFHTHS